jgi:hypothetical protein
LERVDQVVLVRQLEHPERKEEIQYLVPLLQLVVDTAGEGLAVELLAVLAVQVAVVAQ